MSLLLAPWRPHGYLSDYILFICRKELQSQPTLCDPRDCSLPGPSVHGISQARILEWVAMFCLGDLPNPRIESVSPALQADSLPLSHLRIPYTLFIYNSYSAQWMPHEENFQLQVPILRFLLSFHSPPQWHLNFTPPPHYIKSRGSNEE